MTAVASPPNLSSLQRLGWNSSGNGNQGGLNAMSTEDVTRMFLPRKGPQRTNSSSSLSSNASSASTASDSTVGSTDIKSKRENQSAAGDKEGWVPQKYGRALWPQVKAEPAPALNGSVNRSQAGQTPSQTSVSVTATPAMSALHAAAPIVPSQKSMQPMQQINGSRLGPPAAGSDPPALLVLLPMNGTFERKQITVPLFPEMLKIGRQTNAKTVPTPHNGFFDSKVLSRQHAEIWADRNGKVWIRDVKSSNGTFVNGVRLSPESRESEPHELRENDMLELGIDIVSEDQKSIVHHKVSAKVEHAGIHASATSVLDLNFGDIDPSSNGGLMSPIFPQQIQMRGRGSSQGSMMSNGRIVGTNIVAANMNPLGVQRHTNWGNLPTIEQVYKKLLAEVKQATQQRSDLNQTDHFLHALLATEPGQEPPKPPADILPPEPQSNGVIPPLPKMDPMSPFSQPPAPPPQQPLPEKPDVVRAMNPDPNHSISLKRIETEKPQSPMAASPNATTSPHKAESSIVQLLEALTTTRKELDLQGNRVRQLEELLKQERRARESAEERARHLLDRARMMSLEHNRQVEKIVEPPIHDLGSDGTASSSSEDDHDHSSSETDSIISTPATSNIVEMQKDTDNIDATTARLQERLVIMVREMDEMKAQMEGFKSRAETAEGERTSLAEMVERIRQNEEKKARSMEGGLRKKKSTEMATQTETASAAAETNSSAENGTGLHQPKAHDSTKAPTETNGAVVTPSRPTQEQLQSAIAAALSNRDDRLMQSAPYASILGVVLIGVGIMTYLNGWQKVER